MTQNPHSLPSNRNRNTSSTLIYAILLAWAMNTNAPSTVQGQQQSREVLEGASIEPQVGRSLPLAAEFRDHLGQTVRLSDIVGKRPLVMCLVYFECPMLCKLAANGLVQSVASVPENVGQDFDVVVVSFDPRDTPERAKAAREQSLRHYAREGTAEGWHFLTGSQENVDLLTEAVGFHYQWNQDTKQFAHAAGLMIIAPDGVITEYLDGVHFSPRSLISAVNRSARNELTVRPSTSFVRCYLYDPTTGKFGAAVQWTIRILGLSTVIALAVGIYRLNRRAGTQSEGVTTDEVFPS